MACSPKISLTDIVTIELMKSQADHSEYHPNVDSEIPFDLRECYEKRPGIYLPRLIAERARLYCERRLGVSRQQIDSYVSSIYLFVAVIVLASWVLLAAMATSGVPQRLFTTSEREANISRIIGFIGLLSIACLPQIFSLSYMWCNRWLGRKTPLPIILAILSRQRLVVRALGYLRNIVPIEGNEALPETITNWRELASRCTYCLSALFVFVANLYFLLVALFILLVMCFYLSFEEVNYSYQSSLHSMDARATVLEVLNVPASFLVSPPSCDAIAWADNRHLWEDEFSRSIKQSVNDEHPSSSISKSTDQAQLPSTHRTLSPSILITEYRKQWSQYLLGLVAGWALLPRILIAAVSAGSFIYFKRDLLPRGSDPLSIAIVNNILTRDDRCVDNNDNDINNHNDTRIKAGTTVVFGDAIDSVREGGFCNHEDNSGLSDQALASCDAPIVHRMDDDDTQAIRAAVAVTDSEESSVSDELLSLLPGESAQDQQPIPCSVTAKSIPAAARSAAESAIAANPLPSSAGTLLIGYDLSETLTSSFAALVSSNKAFENGGVISGAEQRATFLRNLNSDRQAKVDKAVFVISLSSVPDRSFKQILKKTCEHFEENNARVCVVLSDGNATRSKFGGDIAAYTNRLELWRTQCIAEGVSPDFLYEIDISSPVGAKSLSSMLVGCRPAIRLKMAGNFIEAIDVVRQSLKESLLASQSGLVVDWEMKTIDITTRIVKIYDTQVSVIKKMLQTTVIKENAQALLAKVKLTEDLFPKSKQLEQVYAVIQYLSEKYETLSPSWMIAGAAIGGLGASAVAFTVGGFAATAIAVSMFPYAIGGGALGGQLLRWRLAPSAVDNTSDMPNERHFDANAERVLQACVFEIALFEFQGNSETDISRQIDHQKNAIEPVRINCIDDIDKVLNMSKSAFEVAWRAQQ